METLHCWRTLAPLYPCSRPRALHSSQGPAVIPRLVPCPTVTCLGILPRTSSTLTILSSCDPARALDCYPLPCHPMPCHLIPCYPMLCHAMPPHPIACQAPTPDDCQNYVMPRTKFCGGNPPLDGETRCAGLMRSRVQQCRVMPPHAAPCHALPPPCRQVVRPHPMPVARVDSAPVYRGIGRRKCAHGDDGLGL